MKASWSVLFGTVVLLALSAACSSAHGSPSDAAVIGDSGLLQVPYWQWYYPDCGAPGTCDHPGCSRVQLTVSPVDVCKAPDTNVMTGCVPSPQLVQDNSMYQSSMHQLIVTASGPYTTDGLSICVDDGVAPGTGRCCSWIDGGVSDPSLFP